MDHRIPEGIVAVTQELASDLAAWCGVRWGRSLEEHEAAVLTRVRGLLGKLLGAVLTETTPGSIGGSACYLMRSAWSESRSSSSRLIGSRSTRSDWPQYWLAGCMLGTCAPNGQIHAHERVDGAKAIPSAVTRG